MPSTHAGAVRPPIILIDTEADALSDLALSSPASSLGARLLLEELERADVYDARSLPGNVVTMRSHVIYEDESTGDRRRVQLVYPKDADTEFGRVSVTTPVGAALIGLPEGAVIDWPTRTGAPRRLRILQVTQPETTT